MEKNVICPDTVGILEIIYILTVYIVADQSTLFLRAREIASCKLRLFRSNLLATRQK
jgi:hypothetical protein